MSQLPILGYKRHPRPVLMKDQADKGVDDQLALLKVGRMTGD